MSHGRGAVTPSESLWSTQSGTTHGRHDKGGLIRYARDDGTRIDICWLVCLASQVPSEDAGALPDFLSDRELEVFARLRFAKRRREWLLGRWTAKQLFRRCWQSSQVPPLQAISVANDPDGAPYLLTADEGRLPLSLSISHCQDRALCALACSSVCEVGADVEHVEPRDPAFVQDFFTLSESTLVSHCAVPLRDTFITILWSAKEAVLKAMRYGLRADTRQVQIGLLPESSVVSPSGPLPEAHTLQAWRQLCVSTARLKAAHVIAWYNVDGDSVYTLAVATATAPALSLDSPDSASVL